MIFKNIIFIIVAIVFTQQQNCYWYWTDETNSTGVCFDDMGDQVAECYTTDYFGTVTNTNCGVPPNGYFFIYQSTLYLACATGCSECDDAGTSSCKKCVNNYFLGNQSYQQTTCYAAGSCPDGQYNAAGNEFCLLCDTQTAKCLTCASTASNCKSCTSNYFLYDYTSCLQTCPDGDGSAILGTYGNVSFICANCQANCNSCKNGSTCDQCWGNLVYTMTNSCVTTCPKGNMLTINGQYLTSLTSIGGTYLCDYCSEGCNKCQVKELCLQCFTNYYLDLDGYCGITCPNGDLGSTLGQGYNYNNNTYDTWLCQLCISNCNNCAADANICVECFTGILLALNNTCVLECPVGDYVNVGQGKSNQKQYTTYLCKICSNNCNDCTENVTICVQCFQNLFMAIDTTCWLNCPNGDLTTILGQGYSGTNNTIGTKTCINCTDFCNNCSIDANVCVQCWTGYYLGLDNKCYVACPNGDLTAIVGQGYNGFQNDYSTLICENCSGYCNNCSIDATKCVQCWTTYYLALDNTCDSVCPNGDLTAIIGQGYGGNQNIYGTNVCVNCSNYCNDCNVDALICVQCWTGYFMAIDTTCWLNCPNGDLTTILGQGYSGTNNTIGTKTCINCTDFCNNCSIDANVCVQCWTGYYLALDQICYAACPNGDLTAIIGQGYNGIQNTYGTYVCIYCSNYCTDCSANASICVQCWTGYFMAIDTTCWLNCPNGDLTTILGQGYSGTNNTIGTKTCINCTDFCNNCSIDANVCVQCWTGYYLGLDNKCYVACPNGDLTAIVGQGYNGFQNDYSTLLCENCSGYCNNCSIDATKCVQCWTTYYLALDNTCDSVCPNGDLTAIIGQGYGGNQNIYGTNVCVNCSNYCNDCNVDALICVQCWTGYFMAIDTTCWLNCPNGDLTTILGQGYSGTNNTIGTKTCINCTDFCNNCSIDANVCVQCWTGYYLGLDNKCYVACPNGDLTAIVGQGYNGFQNDYSTLICENCSGYCNNCSIDATKCVQCWTTYYLALDNTCDSVCPNGDLTAIIGQGYGGNQNIYGTNVCVNCSNYCNDCNVDALICVQCWTGYFMAIDTTCWLNCPNGDLTTILGQGYSGTNNTIGTKTCINCTDFCNNCSIDANVCVQCWTGYYLGLDNKCYVACPNGDLTAIVGQGYNGFQNDYSTLICENCSGYCNNCSIDATKCVQCWTTYYLALDNTCDSVCPNGDLTAIIGQGYGGNQNIYGTNVCVNCSNYCNDCNVDALICVQCWTGYFMAIDTTCWLNCPNGDLTTILGQGYSGTNNTIGTKTCINCTDFCNNCSIDANVCVQCWTGYYLGLDNKCYVACPNGDLTIILGQGSSGVSNDYSTLICENCSGYCNNCSIDATKCVQCWTTYYLALDNTCDSVCPNGDLTAIIGQGYGGNQNIYGTNVCVNCSNYCNDCNVDALICVQCWTGYFMAIDTTCWLNCPNGDLTTILGQGYSGTNNTIGTKTCINCTDFCNNCSIDANVCVQCWTGYYLGLDNKCYVACPNGDLTAIVGQGYNGFQNDYSTLICENCSGYCNNCSIDATKCVQCWTTYYLALDNTCDSVCPNGDLTAIIGQGYGGNQNIYGTNVCVNCSNYCNDCNVDALICVQCWTGYFMAIDTTCWLNCPNGDLTTILGQGYSGTNNTIGTKTCINCTDFCNNCSIDANVCVQCWTGYYLALDQICYAACPNGDLTAIIGQGYNGIQNTYGTYVCIYCSNYCADCSANASICVQCWTGYFMAIDTTCWLNCPNGDLTTILGQGYSGTNNTIGTKTCINCTDFCNNCSIDANVCVQCWTGYYLGLDNKCYVACPNGDLTAIVGQGYNGIQNDYSTLLCENCSGYCNNCSVDVTMCIQCFPSLFLLINKTCFNICPTGDLTTLVGQGDSGLNNSYNTPICNSCSSNCYNCTINASICVQCVQTYFLAVNFTCFNPCPIGNNSIVGQYNSGIANDYGTLQCYECSADCNQCDDITVCNQCFPSYFLKIDYNCFIVCPTGDMLINVGQGNSSLKNSYGTYLCKNCTDFCNNCASDSAICVQCFTNYLLTLTNTCIDVCPIGDGSLVVGQGYTSDKNSYETFLCGNCISDFCNNCSITINQCSQCINDTQYIIAINNTCLLSCPNGNNTSGQFGQFNSSLQNDQGSYFCKYCISNCYSCNQSTKCIICMVNYLLEEINKICVSICPEGNVSNLTVGEWDASGIGLIGLCELCSNYCNKCFDDYTCTQCWEGYYFGNSSSTLLNYSGLNGTKQTPVSQFCYRFGECPDGQYNDDLNLTNCYKCNASCVLCNTSPINCSKCADAYFLIYGTYTCSNYCPNGDNSTVGQYPSPSDHVCVLCYEYCATCVDGTNVNCTLCVANISHLSIQRKSCNENCSDGDYSTLIGQYLSADTSNCQKCDPLCNNCTINATNCYTCMDIASLVDSNEACNRTYNGCTVCTSKCLPDKTCVQVCPDYYYMIPKSNVLSDLSNLYNSSSYQSQTNLCNLCYWKCFQCFGPTKQNCTNCTDHNYLWVNSTICDTYCPTGQFIMNITFCGTCDSNCIICTGSSSNCSKCKTGYYLYQGNFTNYQCLVSCPGSNNNLTTIGSYGQIQLSICLSCISPCQNCNINSYIADVGCIDYQCSNFMICTSCLSGYILVQGKCISYLNCRQYSIYIPTSSMWAPQACICIQGYYFSDYVTCSICDQSCYNCAGNLSTQCTECYNGYILTTGSCILHNQTIILGSYSSSTQSLPSDPLFSNIANINQCGSYYTLGGFNVTNNGYFTFSMNNTGIISALINGNLTLPTHYLINFRFVLLFIDIWSADRYIYLSDPSGNVYFQWNFNNYTTIGQQLCGQSYYDYIFPFNVSFNHTDNTISDAQTYILQLNSDSSRLNQYWGVLSYQVSIIMCDVTCTTCYGSQSTNCLTCTDTKTIAVDGVCTCDISNNYYYSAEITGCDLNCQSGLTYIYMDTISGTCIENKSNCSYPNIFLDMNLKICVSICSIFNMITYYASDVEKICTTNCSSFGEYAYSAGGNNTCHLVCPNNYVATLEGNCNVTCPDLSYRLAEDNITNPKCALNCSSSTFAFDGQNLNICVYSCPVGYYSFTDSNANICMKNCSTTINPYGDKLLGICTSVCSGGYFADPLTNLCVLNCPENYYQQITNTDQTCVLQCKSDQWGNPLTYICVTQPTECPDGYYADNHTNMCVTFCTSTTEFGDNITKMCQTTCSIPGYSQSTLRLCIAACYPLFGYIDGINRTCVNSCDSTITGYYGDSQQSNRCVQKCSNSPVLTFGDNSTSLCVSRCPGNSYGDPLNLYCVFECTALTFKYAPTNLCVNECPAGTYGDSTGVCSPSCPSPYFGNSLTHLCSTTCPTNQFGDNSVNRECVQVCPFPTFGDLISGICTLNCPLLYYGDNNTRICTISCTVGMYADTIKQLCVSASNCSLNTYADNYTNSCTFPCSYNGSRLYGDLTTQTCVSLCPIPYYADTISYLCTLTCSPSLFIDDQTRSCVSTCSQSPISFFSNHINGLCVIPSDCPPDYFADTQSLACISTCTNNLPYGDPTTQMCVLVCPETYYGLLSNNLCVLICTDIYYADNNTGLCVDTCPTGTYALKIGSSGTCQLYCPLGLYASNFSHACVITCQSGYYADASNRVCLSDPTACPDGYYGDSSIHTCVLPTNCSNGYFASNSTKTCVSQCPISSYGDSSLNLCVLSCNNTSFGQNNTRLCLQNCLGTNSYADSQLHLCVSICSSIPISTFGETSTFTCVEAIKCPANSYAQYLVNPRLCINSCPSSPLQYADSISMSCVTMCPIGFYGDVSTGTGLCVAICPINYFASNYSQTCVLICQALSNTFGDVTTGTCVLECPPNYYMDMISRLCSLNCPIGTWANLLTFICVDNPLNCPNNTWADSLNLICQSLCTSGFYGDNSTRTCVSSCPKLSYAYNPTRVCIDLCPNDPLGRGLFGDSGFCVYPCQTANTYMDVITRTCSSSCTFNNTYKSYANDYTHECTSTCPVFPIYYFAQDFTATCVQNCQSGYYKNTINQSCVLICPNLLQPYSATCVAVCPADSSIGQILYADYSINTCVISTSCKTGTYASYDSLSCVSTCPINTYILQSSRSCVYFCPSLYYMDQINNICVLSINCPINTFGSNITLSCVTNCPNSYGDPQLKMCVTSCSAGLYADPYTHLCQISCTNNQNISLYVDKSSNSCVSKCIDNYLNPVNNSCESSCPIGYYADNSSWYCTSMCISVNPETYGDPTTQTCVVVCPLNYYRDIINRVCTQTCPLLTYTYIIEQICVIKCPSPSYYGINQICVTNCSTYNLYSDDVTRTCVANCSSGYFADPTTYQCVQSCPSNDFGTYYGSVNVCVLQCPINYYADDSTGSCVSICPTSPLTYREFQYRKCVTICPVSLKVFADTILGACVTICPSGYYADNRTRTCVSQCGNYLFADNMTTPPSCNLACYSTYAYPVTMTCVQYCNSPYFGYLINLTCLLVCPSGYYADSSTRMCVQICPISYPYSNDIDLSCVAKCSTSPSLYGYLSVSQSYGGNCVAICPSGFFSDNITQTCVTQCPSGYFGEVTQNTCQLICSLKNGKFANPTNNMCTSTCSIGYFAELYSRSCVSDCTLAASFLYADSKSGYCEITCSNSQFADNSTYTCVSVCPQNTFGDPITHSCVSQCLPGYYALTDSKNICTSSCSVSAIYSYADQQTNTCVLLCLNNQYADPISGLCVQICQQLTFGDPTTMTCVNKCPLFYFADTTKQICVLKCPSIPSLFSDNNTQKCVAVCPLYSYADPTTQICIAICPQGYYADALTTVCVSICSQSYFGDNLTKLCVQKCPSTPSSFADNSTRLCVSSCPIPTFSDSISQTCVRYCPASFYGQNSTQSCQNTCINGFADQLSRLCVIVCPTGYYGDNSSSMCVDLCTTGFADDSSNLCVTQCPPMTFANSLTSECIKSCSISNLFGDPTTNRCVSVCPNGYSANNFTFMCDLTCPTTPQTFSYSGICYIFCPNQLYGDPSTGTCVSVSTCPKAKNLYADNKTMLCSTNCTSQSMFTSNITQQCVYYCSSFHNMFADPISRSCVYSCSGGLFAQPIKAVCASNCLNGYYGVNSSNGLGQSCLTSCSSLSLYANPSNNMCVTLCPYYYDSINWICTSKCPVGTYGNPLNFQCVSIINGVVQCPNGYYGDDSTTSCVKTCPISQNTYADPTINRCVAACPNNYFIDISTLSCVTICPIVPFFYGFSGKCYKQCPLGYYGQNITRLCLSNCPSATFAENNTRICVLSCPFNYKSFADNSTWTCVLTCPSNTFGDQSTHSCVTSCPINLNTYAQATTMMCVRLCPSGFYGENSTMKCVAQCPIGSFADNKLNLCVQFCFNSPILFADQFSNKCVESCPYINGLQYFADYFSHQCVIVCSIVEQNIKQYRENSTKSCTLQCYTFLNSYADNITGYCGIQCVSPNFGNPMTATCDSKCPSEPSLYGQNLTKTCISSCTGNTFADNNTRLCVLICPVGSQSLKSNSGNLCVYQCPLRYYSYNQTCILTCPVAYYADPTTRKCVTNCPVIAQLYSDNTTWSCVSVCPNGYYGYNYNLTCLTSCPNQTTYGRLMFAASYNNLCVYECVNSYFASLTTLKCVTVCPTGFFGNITDNTCYQCSNNCLSCTWSTNCLNCSSNYYLYNGLCLNTCPTIPMTYMNNAKMTCVISSGCMPFFGYNLTNTCIPFCPSGFFSNTANYRCDLCPSSCTLCTNLTYCTNCTPFTLFNNNYCIPYCNKTTSIYYLINGSCTSICPVGTYLSLLNCTLCDAICLTCIGTSTNCTVCSDGLYIQNTTCVSQCNSGYAPFPNFICTPCGLCQNLLNYTINQTSFEGQSVILIQFNKNVTINDSLYYVFGLFPVAKRFLEKSQLSNFPTGVTISQLNPSLLMISLPTTLLYSQYNFKILHPEDITDMLGNLPLYTRTNITIQINQIYSAPKNTYANNFIIFLSIICWIIFLFDTELISLLQLLYIHYFIGITFPASMNGILRSMRLSTLNWLPNFFTSILTPAVLRNNIPAKVSDELGDFLFLRNGGYLITIISVVLFFFLIFKALSVPELNRFKMLRVWCQEHIEQKWTYSIQMFVLNIIFIPIGLFMLLNTRDYYIYDNSCYYSIILSWICLVMALGFYILLFYQVVKFFRQHPKLSDSLVKAADIILQEEEFHQLHSQNMFLFDKKKVDLRNMLYPKVNNQNILPFKNAYKFNIFALFCQAILFARGLALCLILATAYKYPLVQIVLMIFTNIFVLLYMCRVKPYSFKYKKHSIRNYMAILNQLGLIGFELGIMIFIIILNEGASIQDRQVYMNNLVYYVISLLSINFTYFLLRIYVEIKRKVWKVFIQSEFFKNNFPELAKQYERERKEKGQRRRLAKDIKGEAKIAIRNFIKGMKFNQQNKLNLRPSHKQKENPDLPQPFKITYFQRDKSSTSNSKSLSRKQKKDMIQKIFNEELSDKDLKEDWDIINMNKQQKVLQMNLNDDTTEYEQYDEQIEIRLQDLQKFIATETMKRQKNIFDV